MAFGSGVSSTLASTCIGETISPGGEERIDFNISDEGFKGILHSSCSLRW